MDVQRGKFSKMSRTTIVHDVYVGQAHHDIFRYTVGNPEEGAGAPPRRRY